MQDRDHLKIGWLRRIVVNRHPIRVSVPDLAS